MAKLILTVCDKCQERDKPTTTYSVSDGKRRTKVDLCADDAKVLEDMLPSRVGRPPSSTTGARRGRPKKSVAAVPSA